MSTSDFQSEVGEVFGEIGGELSAKFGRRFSSFFCWENRQKHLPPKLHRKFHHQTSLRGSGLWRALPLAQVVQARDAGISLNSISWLLGTPAEKSQIVAELSAAL